MVPLFLTIDETNCKAVDNPLGIKEGTHAFGTDLWRMVHPTGFEPVTP